MYPYGNSGHQRGNSLKISKNHDRRRLPFFHLTSVLHFLRRTSMTTRRLLHSAWLTKLPPVHSLHHHLLLVPVLQQQDRTVGPAGALQLAGLKARTAELYSASYNNNNGPQNNAGLQSGGQTTPIHPPTTTNSTLSLYSPASPPAGCYIRQSMSRPPPPPLRLIRHCHPPPSSPLTLPTEGVALCLPAPRWAVSQLSWVDNRIQCEFWDGAAPDWRTTLLHIHHSTIPHHASSSLSICRSVERCGVWDSTVRRRLHYVISCEAGAQAAVMFTLITWPLLLQLITVQWHDTTDLRAETTHCSPLQHLNPLKHTAAIWVQL